MTGFEQLLLRKLQSEERRIATVFLDQPLMRSRFDDPAAFEHMDAVGVTDGV